MNMRRLALMGICVAALVCGGCAGGAARKSSAKIGPGSGGPGMGSKELDELTQAFAIRYVGLLASARDALKKDNPDLEQRRAAQELLVSGATSIFNITSESNLSSRVLNILVVTTLVSQVWIDDDKATEVFGARAEPLIRALHLGRVEAWQMAGDVLRPDQLSMLDYLLWNWRRYNPDMARAYAQRIQSVRFSNVVGGGKSDEGEVLAAGGLFANVAQATQEIDEARQLTERMFYLLKHEPTLLRWQVELMQDTALCNPEVGKILGDVHGLSGQIEQLPKTVAAERQALLAALDERMNRADATLANVKALLGEAHQLILALGPAGDSLKEILKSADALMARYSAMNPPGQKTPESRPFDVREYTAALKELAATVDKVNDVLKSSNDLLGSPEWNRRVQQMNEAADARMAKASEHGQEMVNTFFWRVYIALGILLVMLVIWLTAAFVMARRLVVKVESDVHAGVAKVESDVESGLAGRKEARK